ncbi:MAG: hypothetical protein HC794_10610 [Nitrospiraceae bacterium]|nr:hypothetical protein [Nitrospiraceae bacterium]
MRKELTIISVPDDLEPGTFAELEVTGALGPLTPIPTREYSKVPGV